MLKYKMEYTLFTLPNCEKCIQVKDYLKDKNLVYREINAGIGEGRTYFKDFYLKHRESIEREGEGVVFPILLYKDEIFQGLENIIKNFE